MHAHLLDKQRIPDLLDNELILDSTSSSSRAWAYFGCFAEWTTAVLMSLSWNNMR